MRMEGLEELPIIPVRDLRQFRKNAAALTREREQLHAAILGFRGARDPPFRFQLADALGNGAPRQIQWFRDFSRSDPWTPLDLTHHNPLGNGGVSGPQRPGEGAGNMVGNAAKPIAKVRFQIGRRG